MKLKSSSLSLFLALLLFWLVFSPTFHQPTDTEDMITSPTTFVVINTKARKAMPSSLCPKHKSNQAMEQSLKAKPPSLPNPTQN